MSRPVVGGRLVVGVCALFVAVAAATGGLSVALLSDDESVSIGFGADVPVPDVVSLEEGGNPDGPIGITALGAATDTDVTGPTGDGSDTQTDATGSNTTSGAGSNTTSGAGSNATSGEVDLPAIGDPNGADATDEDTKLNGAGPSSGAN